MKRIPLLLLLTLCATPAAHAQEELRGVKKKIKIEWAESKTKNFLIKHEKVIPKTSIDRVGKELEDILVQYIAIFKAKPKGKLKVKFLDTLNTYEQEGGDPSHPGFYDPRSKFLYIRQMPFHSLIPIVYHEAFHQYLDMYMEGRARIPIWFNEGMASYYEGMQRDARSKKLNPKKINCRKLRMVKDAIFTRQHIPLAKLIDASYDEFHDKEKESLHYTQSFALIYFFIKALGPKSALKYAKELKKTQSTEKALETICGKERKKLKKMESAFKRYMADFNVDATAK